MLYEVITNDGKIDGVVRSIDGEGLQIQITRAKPTGSRLRGDKGINFPGSRLNLVAMTEKDSMDLGFVARHADMVALSFANRVDSYNFV